MQRECWYELEEATGKGAHAHLCSGVHALLHRSLPWGSVCPEAAEDPDT